ncbi:hypothetical protein QFC21_004059 [Naganishia friedmannii]|uniref:Uncharacterized protein n=1 Tax=Naganishia friedmannii TaxID=89922 RepID=A0ACC2VJL2_9TREE|nr:hypothetical protein QFC21_004059 [Naganishia friedmannii]
MRPPTRAATRQETVSYLRRIHHPAANDDDEAKLSQAVQQDPMKILRELMFAHNLFIPFENTFITKLEATQNTITKTTDTLLYPSGDGRRGPLVPIPLPTSQQIGAEGDIAGPPTLPIETWRIVAADLSDLVQPKDAENTLPSPTYLLQHRSLRKGQTEQDAQWDVLYAFTTETEDLEVYERLSWHVCIGEKGVSHKFREYFTVSRTYQPGSTGPEFPREQASDCSNPTVFQPVDFTTGLARLSLTNMELSAFEAGEKKVLCEFKDEQERVEGLKRWFGLKGPFDGKL